MSQTGPNNMDPKDESGQDINHGVADYFAVLGIGESMVLKSTQKKNCYASENQQDLTEEEREEQRRQQEEEDECLMMERFYREITDVGILTITTPTDNSNFSLDSKSPASSVLELSTSNTMETDITSSFNVMSTSLPNHQSRVNFSPLLSTSSSFATTEGKSDDLFNNNDSTSNTNKSNNSNDDEEDNNNDNKNKKSSGHDPTNTNTPTMKPQKNQRPVDIAGYSILWDTLPAGKGSSFNDNNNTNSSFCHSVNESALDESFCDHHSIANGNNLNHSREYNNNKVNNSTVSLAQKDTWVKGQIHKADLNPSMGLRGSLLCASADDRHSFDFYQKSFETATTAKNHNLNSNNNELQFQNNDDGYNNINSSSTGGGGLSGFGRKVRNHLAPIVLLGSHAASAAHYHSNLKSKNSIAKNGQGLNTEFYVVYRRRGADETRRPAIADIVLKYVRIHTNTIIHTSPPIQSNSKNKNATGASSNNEEIKNNLNTSGAEDEKQKKRVTALRKGFVTGAAIATRVATSGRNRLKTIHTSNNKDNGNTELPPSPSSPPKENKIPSPRLTSKYFFPNKNIESKDQHCNNIGHQRQSQQNNTDIDSYDYEEIQLGDLIPLPEGYDKWIIPKRYKTLHIPKPSCHNKNNDVNNFNDSGSINSFQSNQTSKLEDDGDDTEFVTTYNCEDQEDFEHLEERRAQRRIRKTHLFEQEESKDKHRNKGVETDSLLSPASLSSGLGIEALIDGDTFLKQIPTPKASLISNDHHVIYPQNDSDYHFYHGIAPDVGNKRNDIHSPSLVSSDALPIMYDSLGTAKGDADLFQYVPIIAIRRQRTTDEERYHEDPAIIDLGVSFLDSTGIPVVQRNNSDNGNILEDDEDDEDEDESNNSCSILKKTKWSVSSYSSPICHNNGDNLLPQSSFAFNHDSSSFLEQPLISTHDINEEHYYNYQEQKQSNNALQLGYPVLLSRHNAPLGFADTPFATTVLDRFPKKNYKGLPLPEEELPMFCYPTGCRLYRTMYQEVPIAQSYGFVVKNERGDSIYVSCVSFMEPLTSSKIEKLDKLSSQMRRTSLPHRFFCEKRGRKSQNSHSNSNEHLPSSCYGTQDSFTENGEEDSDHNILTGFNQMTTFENKTICLVGRYPYWTAFRRFLSHLHILSGSSSELPLERWISHLLLAVPVPKLGDQCVIVPLPTLAGPMIMSNPPAKDFPLVDLPFQRLLSCLDVPTIVTIVLSFLALEKKVIIMSTYPSMVSDICELLRALLFPFDLCAPYVPRLTEPFMSCLDFPGAIFVGIHDDGSVDGLASVVRKNIPEDTAVVDVDTGEIDCSENRYEELKHRWSIIPTDAKSELVCEIEALCRDADIVPGQEQIDSHLDVAYDENLSLAIAEELKDQNEHKQELFDERGFRDCFLRFFCSILGGYERFLVVPDMDFLVSGNEWFDSEGFLASVSPNKKRYLSSFISTQMFQSFIQKRTEASDVQCLLFDECLSEYHSTKYPYGRLGINDEVEENGYLVPNYNLLVDQCAAELLDSDVTSSTDYTNHSYSFDANGVMTKNGDIMTSPSHYALHANSQFVYCTDGNPCFPFKFNNGLFYPKEPDQLSAHFAEILVPVLTRSDRERDDAKRREKMIMSHRGVQKHRRCLWQLPKLMGSHVLGSWLMCIPNQVSQTAIGSEQQEKYLLRALGALRILRNRQRIVPDEASYRCLMIACGRCNSDRRVELVKLFGLLRSEGIFPSAVTLGQYTRAIAEGFSKQSSGKKEQSNAESFGDEVIVSRNIENSHRSGNVDLNTALSSLDSNLALLEISGCRWRQKRHSIGNENLHSNNEGEDEMKSIELKSKIAEENLSGPNQQTKRRDRKFWSPISCSSSFSPHWKPSSKTTNSSLICDFQFVAIWSRTSSCEKCHYTPLDEEIQGGWSNADVAHESNDVQCPICENNLQPLLGYSEMSMEKALGISSNRDTFDIIRRSRGYPSQLTACVTNDARTDTSGTVPYLSPSKMRLTLEKYVEEYGEEILDRTTLRRVAPTLFYNLWWFSARFSLPLPLTIKSSESNEKEEPTTLVSYPNQCAFISWDQSVAKEGCRSAAKAVFNLIESSYKVNSSTNDKKETNQNAEIEYPFYFGEFPLLAYFNINSFAQSDWDHPDFSKILVRLVEACDKREFQSVITCIRQCNDDRRHIFVRNPGTLPGENMVNELTAKTSELECYKTLLYLVRYQCTTAFHVFFPTTVKCCKGYHYWCPIGTPLPIFDRMFLDALNNGNTGKVETTWHYASDVALGFRCIFGHII